MLMGMTPDEQAIVDFAKNVNDHAKNVNAHMAEMSAQNAELEKDVAELMKDVAEMVKLQRHALTSLRTGWLRSRTLPATTEHQGRFLSS